MLTALFALATSTSAQAAPARLFSCESLTPIDPAMVLHLDFGVDVNDLPTQAKLTSVQTGSVVLKNSARYKPNYDGGYWFTNYGLDAYSLGSPDGWTTYSLLIPAGILGSQFDAQLHLWWDHGAAGWFPEEFACVEVP